MKKIIYILTIFSALLFLFACSKNSSEPKSFEDYISTTDFTDFKYDSENDIYIVSIDLNSSISDENAIQNFNDSIYDVIHADSKPDKDVVFRAWDGSIAASLVYFKKDKFNSLADEVFNSSSTYLKADGWQTISKFGQYQESNDHSDDSTTENLLFNLAMISK